MITLDITVGLKAKTGIKDLDFTYTGSTTPPSPDVSVTKVGDILIDKSVTDPVCINFDLDTTAIEVGGIKYTISFELADTRSTPLHIDTSALPVPTDVFRPGCRPSPTDVGTKVMIRDANEYKYTLTVGANDGLGTITDVPHDPKIKNGGDTKRLSPIDGAAGVVIGIVVLAVIVSFVAWFAKRRTHRDGTTRR